MKLYFGRQVIERPRAGSGNPSVKMKMIGCIDAEGEYDGPSRIKMSRGAVSHYTRKIQGKCFTDLLGPVRRYMQGKVGCRWDDVFSELSAALGSGGHAVQHVLYGHILSTSRDAPMRLYAGHGEYYVDGDGIVRFRPSPRYRRMDPNAGLKVDAGDGTYFVRIKGIWYLGTYREALPVHSVVLPPEWPDYREGRRVFRFVKAKQANHKELKRLKGLL